MVKEMPYQPSLCSRIAEAIFLQYSLQDVVMMVFPSRLSTASAVCTTLASEQVLRTVKNMEFTLTRFAMVPACAVDIFTTWLSSLSL